MKKDNLFNGVFAITILLIALALFASTCTAQEKNEGWLGLDWKREIAPCALMFGAGFFEGQNELIRHDYAAFKNIWPGARDQWWDPEISWKNKYKNFDQTQGPRHWGSTSVLVFTTDGYHATQMAKRTCFFTAIAIGNWPANNWKQLLVRFVLYAVSNRAGFFVGYEIPRAINK